MRELLSIADRIAELTREIPVSSYSGFLDETNRKIRKISAEHSFYIDLFSSIHASSEINRLSHALESSALQSDFLLVHKNEDNYKIRVFDHVFPSVLFVFTDHELLGSAGIKEYFRTSEEQYKVVFLVDMLDDDAKFADFTRIFNYRTKKVLLKKADLEQATLAALLNTHIEAKTLEALKKFSYLNSVKPVFSFLSDILLSENRAANTRKILNTQNTNITKKEELTINNSELATALRQMIQKSTQELEKSYKFKYDDLNKPNTGSFSIVAAERSGQLSDFNRKELAEKSEKVETTIDSGFLTAFTAAISTTIRNELGKDEAFIKFSFEDLIKLINIQLKAKNISPLDAGTLYPQFPDKERTIQSFCYINKAYTGEIIKRGAMEYFVALRDYTGLIMVVGGLLAPLSMFASGWDGSLFKSMADWVKRSVAGISILMVVYGIYDLRRRIPLKREEEFQRELLKAKETLLQESKKMFSDSSRDWTGNISNWIKDTAQNINNQIDRNIKELQMKRVAQMNEEKAKQQKQLQSIEMLLKSIQSAERVKDQISSRYKDLMTDTEKDLKL